MQSICQSFQNTEIRSRGNNTMELTVRWFLVGITFWGFHNVVCKESVDVPLTDNLQAPLKATIDISLLNKEIIALIKNEVKRAMEEVATDIVTKILSEKTEVHIRNFSALSTEVHNRNFSALSTKGNDDVCQSASPCLNGASCSVNKKSYSCSCMVGFYGERCQYSDSKGTDFILLFRERYRLSYAVGKALIAKGEGNIFSVYYFHNHQSIRLLQNQHEYSLKREEYRTHGIKNVGAEIRSSRRISLYGLSYNNAYDDDNSDGYLAIPSMFLSTTYVVASFKVNSSYNYSSSMIAITPTKFMTTVNLNFRMSSGTLMYKNRAFTTNDNLTVVVNKYETFEISHTSDLTGTLITSSGPLAVVSGNKCNNFRYVLLSGCTTFIEMVLPVEQFDTTYIIPNIETRTNSTVRVITYHDTTVYINDQNKQNIGTRKYIDFYHTRISYVNANKDIYVMIYPHELNNYKGIRRYQRYNGDAFMMTVPGINQYLYEYDFVVPTRFTSYISVTVQTGELNGFILDGKFISIDKVYTTAVNNTSYSSFTKPIENGEHLMNHSRHIPFGLWIYGNGYKNAYGYPAGIKFKTNK